MADERELIAERERKVAELREAGRNPYANDFAPTHTTREIRDRFAPALAAAASGATAAPAAGPGGPAPLSDEIFRVAGRVVALRAFGGATFVKILDRGGEL